MMVLSATVPKNGHFVKISVYCVFFRKQTGMIYENHP